MKKTRNILFAIVSAVIMLTGVQVQAETIQTRIGNLEFTHDFANGYPTDATVDKLFDEIDFQRASQAYIWSIPIVAMAQWQYAYTQVLGASNGQIGFTESYDDKRAV